MSELVSIDKSKKLRQFFKGCGVTVTGTCHNRLVLINQDGDKLELYAEAYSSVASGIPGLFVNE